MPEISRFYGIVIRMYFGDHTPPHLQPRALGMVMEWASLHQKELMRLWNKAAQNQPLEKIEPLP